MQMIPGVDGKSLDFNLFYKNILFFYKVNTILNKMIDFGLFILLLLGAILIYLGWQVNQKECLPRVEYRFIPRTFKEEMQDPVKVSEVFQPMFQQENYLIY